MRRWVGAVVVIGIIGVWNLAGQWFIRRDAVPDIDPDAVVHVDSSGVPSRAWPPSPAGNSAPPSLPVRFRTQPLVFLSTAPAESLDLLPGVGPVLAARIIDVRQSRGAFASWNDVLGVKGIGPRTVDRWRRAASGQ